MLKFLKKLLKKSQPLYRSGWEMSSDSYVSVTSSAPPLQIGSVSITEQGLVDMTKKKEKTKKLAVKPVKLWKQIISEIPKINLNNLDKQIKIVQERRRVLKEHLELNTDDEDEALIFLKARKKLLKKPKHDFKWAVTNIKKIKELCDKYEVDYVDIRAYYKTLPNEAVKELDKFMKEFKKYSNAEPVIKLIIDDEPEEGKTQSAERKKDPILLASSPFGKWFFILGAWDKEVKIVDDLIYNFK